MLHYLSDYILLRKTLQMSFMTQRVGVDIKIDFMCNRSEDIVQYF